MNIYLKVIAAIGLAAICLVLADIAVSSLASMYSGQSFGSAITLELSNILGTGDMRYGYRFYTIVLGLGFLAKARLIRNLIIKPVEAE